MSLAPQHPRIGLGWDRHAVASGRPCTLAGITLECSVGPVGHSDGDVLLHALTDALLGAAGLDDLGTLFPNDDPQWSGAASSDFVLHAMKLLQQENLRPLSADLVVMCEQPRIGKHRAQMRERLAELLELPLERVNLKGKSTEGGSEAAASAIEVQAVVLLGALG